MCSELFSGLTIHQRKGVEMDIKSCLWSLSFGKPSGLYHKSSLNRLLCILQSLLRELVLAFLLLRCCSNCRLLLP